MRASDCFKKDFDYQGADIRHQGGVESVEECVELCQDVDGCVAVAYQASTTGCWFKNKRNGASPGVKIGVDSANLFCFRKYNFSS